jgi:hypothetical protein
MRVGNFWHALPFLAPKGCTGCMNYTPSLCRPCLCLVGRLVLCRPNQLLPPGAPRGQRCTQVAHASLCTNGLLLSKLMLTSHKIETIGKGWVVTPGCLRQAYSYTGLCRHLPPLQALASEGMNPADAQAAHKGHWTLHDYAFSCFPCITPRLSSGWAVSWHN